MAAREPERTCVGCRRKAPKRALLRIVRSADGVLEADPEGVRPGRGAYVHPDGGCLGLAFERGALARALRASLGPDEAARLMVDMERTVPT